MLKRLKALLQDRAPLAGAGSAHAADELQLAAAALLVEAGRLDGTFEAVESETVVRLLRERFALDLETAAELAAQAERRVAESSQYFGFAHAINRQFSHEERIELIEMLWQVVYADGILHEYEASLMRRIAGLLHVPDGENGAARKRVLERMGKL
jgi:uncharacterized tellurite resistance protein B-like protein